MKARAILIIFLGIFLSLGFFTATNYSQESNNDNNDNKDNSSNKNINFVLQDEVKDMQKLLGEDLSESFYKVLIDSFETAGLWKVDMPTEQGFIIGRSMLGAPVNMLKNSPSQTQTLPSDNNTNSALDSRENENKSDKYFIPYTDEKKYFLGVKVNFHVRGHHRFSVKPSNPIKIQGFVRAFELWVAGRRKNYDLYFVLEDKRGNSHNIFAGKLNFFGWKRLTISIPSYVVQSDPSFSKDRGLIFKGFLIKCDPLETYGAYYIYFDNFVATIDRFWEEYKDQKDEIDVW